MMFNRPLHPTACGVGRAAALSDRFATLKSVSTLAAMGPLQTWVRSDSAPKKRTRGVSVSRFARMLANRYPNTWSTSRLRARD